MLRIALLVIACLAAAPLRAAGSPCVPATELVAAAQAALQARARADQIPARFAVVGRVNDACIASSGPWTIRVGEVQQPWLRPRLGVAVQVWVGEQKVSSTTVWFSVSAPTSGAVYAQDYPQHQAASELRVRSGSVDLARTHGAILATPEVPVGHRLRRAVTAGQPALPDDFEQMPAVVAQQPIRIQVAHGVVRLTTTGRSLADGNVGETIPVLPTSAAQPVRARVVSSQVVAIEN